MNKNNNETELNKENNIIENNDLTAKTSKKKLKIKEFIKKPIVKKVTICTLVGACMVSSYFIGKEVGINSPATSKFYFPSSKLATVNGDIVPFNDFKASMNILFYLNKSDKMSDEEISNYEAELIEYITLNKAIYDVAVKAGVTVDEESVKTSYSSIMEQLNEMLNMDNETILKKFKLTEDGILESLRQEYIVNLYLEQESEISDEDALKYYNENQDEFYQYKASHILISTTDEEGNDLSVDEKKKAKEKAEDLLSQIKKGANFEELAKSNSSDKSAEDG